MLLDNVVARVFLLVENGKGRLYGTYTYGLTWSQGIDTHIWSYSRLFSNCSRMFSKVLVDFKLLFWNVLERSRMFSNFRDVLSCGTVCKHLGMKLVTFQAYIFLIAHPPRPTVTKKKKKEKQIASSLAKLKRNMHKKDCR